MDLELAAWVVVVLDHHKFGDVLDGDARLHVGHDSGGDAVGDVVDGEYVHDFGARLRVVLELVREGGVLLGLELREGDELCLVHLVGRSA